MRVVEVEFILDDDRTGTQFRNKFFNQQVGGGMGKIMPIPRRLRDSLTPDVMPIPRRLRDSFTADALARFSRLFDEVWKELLEEGVLAVPMIPGWRVGGWQKPCSVLPALLGATSR